MLQTFKKRKNYRHRLNQKIKKQNVPFLIHSDLIPVISEYLVGPDLLKLRLLNKKMSGILGKKTLVWKKILRDFCAINIEKHAFFLDQIASGNGNLKGLYTNDLSMKCRYCGLSHELHYETWYDNVFRNTLIIVDKKIWKEFKEIYYDYNSEADSDGLLF